MITHNSVTAYTGVRLDEASLLQASGFAWPIMYGQLDDDTMYHFNGSMHYFWPVAYLEGGGLGDGPILPEHNRETKIANFEPKIKKVLGRGTASCQTPIGGKGHHLPTTHLSRSLWHLEPCAFGCRPPSQNLKYDTVTGRIACSAKHWYLSFRKRFLRFLAPQKR